MLCFLPFFTNCGFDDHSSEVCFIGDSITYLWDIEQDFPTEVIHKHAISGSTIQDVGNWDVSDCKGIPTVLLIGTNNFGYLTSIGASSAAALERFYNSYKSFVSKLDADPLLAISILPRNMEHKEDSTINIIIQDANKSIINILDSNLSHYKYIDVYKHFIYNGNNLREDLFKDGLHPNEAGYKILAEEIEKKL